MISVQVGQLAMLLSMKNERDGFSSLCRSIKSFSRMLLLDDMRLRMEIAIAINVQ
jgi:hypothetical protein